MINLIRAATPLLAFVLLSACGGSTNPEFDGDTPEPTPPQNVAQPTPEPVIPTPTPLPTEVPDLEPTPLPVPTAVPTLTPTKVPPPSLKKVSANISWLIPEQRENGESLTMSEIGGYEIIFRKIDEIIFDSVVIPDQTASEYMLEDLDPGQYEFMIAAFDSEGLYSDFSTPAIIDLGD